MNFVNRKVEYTKQYWPYGMVKPTCTWADEAAEQQFHEFPAEFAHLSVAWQQCE